MTVLPIVSSVFSEAFYCPLTSLQMLICLQKTSLLTVNGRCLCGAKHSRKWQCLIQVRRFNGQTPRFLTRCWSSSQLNFCQGSWQDIIKMNIVLCLLGNPPTSILYLHNSFEPNHTLFGINSNQIGSNDPMLFGSIQFSKKIIFFWIWWLFNDSSFRSNDFPNPWQKLCHPSIHSRAVPGKIFNKK